MTLRINATYRHSTVGTGTYTRNMLAAVPEAHTLTFPDAFLAPRAGAFWAKRGLEEASAVVPGTLVHPYWATTTSSRSVVAALDLVQFREATSLERRMLERSLRRSSKVLALSSAVGAELHAEFGVEAIVAPAFPDPEWYAAPTDPPAVSGPVRLAYWGGWHPRKRASDLLAALASSTLAADVEVHCTGQAPPISGLRVVSHGPLPRADLVRMVDSCHAAVYPSSEEGFGLPLFEALLRRRPILVQPLPVYREFTVDSDAVIRLHGFDPGAVAEAVAAAAAVRPSDVAAALVRPRRGASVLLLREAILAAVAR